MESITLEKNYQRRQFSPKAAKIAIEHYGWSELAGKPSEVGTKTKPPIIDKPVKLKPIDYPIQKAEVNDDLALSTKKKIISDDSGVRLADDAAAEKLDKEVAAYITGGILDANAPPVKSESAPIVKGKAKRKSPVKSKSKSK